MKCNWKVWPGGIVFEKSPSSSKHVNFINKDKQNRNSIIAWINNSTDVKQLDIITQP